MRSMGNKTGTSGRARPPELGGPGEARVADVLYRYAHEFTVIKGGRDAELGRINHYLIGAEL